MNSREHRELAQRATKGLGPNPVVGIRGKDILSSALTVVRQAVTEPAVTGKHALGFGKEMVRVVSGKSTLAPDRKDRRFGDTAWSDNPVYKAINQSYLAACKHASEWIDDCDFSPEDVERSRFVISLVTDALAPSNLPINPQVIKRLIDTGGKSAVNGARHFVHDVQNNGGLPAQVDKNAFTVGENIATTPGAVVYRNDVLELIQYRTQGDSVYSRPLLIVPPQINKFYVFDLSPEKSFVKFATENGIQVFMVSWRNPTPDQRDWGLDTYLVALEEAVDIMRSITGQDQTNLFAACSGGITAAAFLGHLAARKDDKVFAATSLVSVYDTSTDNLISLFATEESIEAARRRSLEKGVLDGSEMARVFAWMRPNDLVWSYWVNNYLLGQSPPAFDILYWNNDTTCLPAQLHSEFLDLYLHNPLTKPGALVVRDTPVDLSKVDCDLYVLAGTTDHITPWKACFQTSQLMGGKREFVLTNSGHIQSILNPPGNPKASYYINDSETANADDWLEGAERHQDSWWLHWLEWVSTRSGDRKEPPNNLGSATHPAMEQAPGTYVFD